MVGVKAGVKPVCRGENCSHFLYIPPDAGARQIFNRQLNAALIGNFFKLRKPFYRTGKSLGAFLLAVGLAARVNNGNFYTYTCRRLNYPPLCFKKSASYRRISRSRIDFLKR